MNRQAYAAPTIFSTAINRRGQGAAISGAEQVYTVLPVRPRISFHRKAREIDDARRAEGTGWRLSCSSSCLVTTKAELQEEKRLRRRAVQRVLLGAGIMVGVTAFAVAVAH